MPLRLIELGPNRPHLYGATAGQQHLSRLLPELNGLNGQATAFLLNLSGVTSVTGSYLRATVHWALLCGKAEAQGEAKSSHLDRWSIQGTLVPCLFWRHLPAALQKLLMRFTISFVPETFRYFTSQDAQSRFSEMLNYSAASTRSLLRRCSI